MADVSRMPENSFGYVPTPALVAPIEFTMQLTDYRALGGHMDHVINLEEAIETNAGRQKDHVLSGQRFVGMHSDNPWPGSGGK
jgi:hypothetical protein